MMLDVLEGRLGWLTALTEVPEYIIVTILKMLEYAVEVWLYCIMLIILWCGCVWLVVAVCMDSEVRLLIGDNDDYYFGGEALDSSYYIDNQLSVGRLELCLNGQWGVACQDYWNNEQASVVCSQLGFARVGKSCV